MFDLLLLLVLPYIVSKPRTIRVPVKASEFKLNCSSIGNPLNRMVWFFKKSSETESHSNETTRPKTRLHHRHITISHRKLASKAKRIGHKSATKKSEEGSKELSNGFHGNHLDQDALTRKPSTTTSKAPPEWVNLNSIGYYAPFEKSNSSSGGLRLALSKYQIYEKVFPNNQISSILIIRVSFSSYTSSLALHAI